MTEEVGCRRGRPILVSIRVPDSVEYCRDMGLDLELWLQQDLVDMLVTTGYFRLNPWRYSVQLGKRHGVAVYPCLSDSRVRGESRFRRSSLESYRGRATNAWAAGADGVHLFNYFNPKAALWNELGDVATLRTLDKLYFVTVRDGDPNRFLADGAQHRSEPLLTPSHPMPLPLGQPWRTHLTLGDDIQAAVASGHAPSVTLHLEAPLIAAPPHLHVELNEIALTALQAEDGWIDYAVPVDAVRRGENEVIVTLLERTETESAWNLRYEGGTLPAGPWRKDPGSERTEQKMVDGNLLLADRGTVSGDYLYYRCPWGIDPAAETTVEARVRVDSGTSCLIMANGVSGERLVLTPDRIYLYHHRDQGFDMDTTDGLHVYRLELQGRNMRVFVDDELRIDATGVLGPRGGYPRNELAFGAANSTDIGQALWNYVRARTRSASLHDAVVQIRYPD
jgi:hypothetical protein